MASWKFTCAAGYTSHVCMSHLVGACLWHPALIQPTAHHEMQCFFDPPEGGETSNTFMVAG